MEDSQPDMTHIASIPYDWPHDRDLRPEGLALIIIDMQRDFCERGGYIDAIGYDIGAASALIPAISGLRDAVRAWGGLVIYTREGHRTDLSDLPKQKRFRSANAGGAIGSIGPLGRFLVRGEPGWEIVGALAPMVGEPVIDKPGFSAFYATDLERILQTRGIRHLILVGVTTDVCVHSTLREAVDRGYEALVIADCCAATDERNHRSSLDTICSEGGIFGAVTSHREAIDALTTRSG